MRPLQVTAAMAALLLAVTAAAEHSAAGPELRAPSTLPPLYGPAYDYSLFSLTPSFRFGYPPDDRDEPSATCAPREATAADAIDWCALPPHRPHYRPQRPQISWPLYRAW